ncbi:MAG: diadenosine tetraphosphate hydrolase [Candidatus Moraniibacteriota bacterium]|nr:MAG: diadenosine tetraphosphate hydrolase [Candidatus Moranbacteria bacterium]
MKITNYQGAPSDISCLGCAREEGKIERVGDIFTTAYFDVHQDFEIPIPGFIIISSRRHIRSIDELTNEEKIDFINTVTSTRTAMRKTLGIDTVYLIQEEDSAHHFHLWIFPRYLWMSEKFGTKTPSLRPIMEYARENMKTKENLEKVEQAIEKLQQYLKTSDKNDYSI